MHICVLYQLWHDDL